MRNIAFPLLGGALVAVWGCAAPGTTPADGTPTPAPTSTTSTSPAPSPAVLEAAARADSVRNSYAQADVEFITGMIHHHAQALVMARMAPSHGASPALLTLTQRIINGQKGEIVLMENWLREHDLPVPNVAGMEASMDMPMEGAQHAMHMSMPMHMPGMLTPEQLAELDAARGEEWDRLFLKYMIQHHKGALTMVRELFSSYGAAQSDSIYKLASSISADQSTEIDRMQTMLVDRLFGNGSLR